MLLTGAVFVVLIVIGPVMRTLSYFYSWGQRKQIRELFCTEYFLMQPVFRNRSFTVTYHFIIDEQDAAGVYYLPLDVYKRQILIGIIHNGFHLFFCEKNLFICP